MTEVLHLLGYGAAFVALLAALGSGPTLVLARGFPGRAALAPIAGLAVAACLLPTAGALIPMRIAAWAVLLPAAVLSLGVAAWALRRTPGALRVRPAELLPLAAVALAAAVLVALPGALNGTAGPINFYFADSWGYVLPDLWLRDHTLYEGVAEAGGARLDVPLAQGGAFVELGTRPGLYSVTSASTLLLGTTPDRTHLAILAVVFGLVAAGVWFVARGLGLRPPLAALAAAFALSPSMLTLAGDSSLGNMVALAVAPPLLLVGGRALTRGDRRHLALAAILLGGLIGLYVEFMPPLLVTGALGLGAIVVRQVASGGLTGAWALRAAARLAVMGIGAAALTPVAAERGYTWARAVATAPSAAIAFGQRDITLETAGAWAFGVLHLYELADVDLLSPPKVAIVVGLPILLAAVAVAGALTRRWAGALVLAPIPGALIAATYAYLRYQDGACEYCAWHALTIMLPFLGIGVALGAERVLRRPARPDRLALALRVGVVAVAAGGLAAVARADAEVVDQVADSRQVLPPSTADLADLVGRLPRPVPMLVEATDASPVPVWATAEALWVARQGGADALIDERANFYITPPTPEGGHYSPFYSYVLTPFGGVAGNRRLIAASDGLALLLRAPIDVAVARTGWALDPDEGARAIPWVGQPLQLWVTTDRAVAAALTVDLARPQRDRSTLAFSVDGRPLEARSSNGGRRLCVNLRLRPGRNAVDVRPEVDVAPAYVPRYTLRTYGWPVGAPPKTVGLAGLRARAGSCA